MTPGERSELERLLSTLVDHELNAVEHAQLEELLRSDAECRRFYLAYVDLHFRLTRHPRLSALLEPATPARTSEAARPAAGAKSAVAVRSTRNWRAIAVTAAMTLAATLVVQLFLRNPTPAPTGPSLEVVAVTTTTAAPMPVPAYVATLTKEVDCVWDGVSLRTGMRLLPGKVRLASGTAELQFDGGAQLVLTGPAEFDVRSVTSAEITSGNVLFRSDDTAEPFHLLTPSARFVDFGTEYAVSVGTANEEVHVFDGEVRRGPKSVMNFASASQDDVVSVLAGEARRFNSSGSCSGWSVPLDSERQKVRADLASHFVQTGSDRKFAATELLAYEPFACSSAALPCPKSVSGGRGFSGAWTKACKSEVGPEFRVVDSLWRPQMQSATQGGGVSAGCRGAISRRLAKPIRMDDDAVYYFSYLVRSERRSGEEPCDMQFVLRDHDVSDPQRKLAVTASWSKSKTSLCWEGGGNCTQIPVEPGKTYLVTVKIVVGRSAPDQAFLCLFTPRQPVPATEPTNWTLASRPVLSDLKFDVVQISANTSTPVLVDELRLGTSWAAVAGVYAAP
ncbi:MAG: FecR domain-containing protein [Pirellulales bacterium]